MSKNLIDLGDREEAHGMENPEKVLKLPKGLEGSQTITSEQSEQEICSKAEGLLFTWKRCHRKSSGLEVNFGFEEFDLKQCLQQAELVNVPYLAFTPETEHD